MSWPWRSPQATRRALTDRVKARRPQHERQRRLREIAYRPLLARLFETQPDRWVVRGGAALLLRLDPNRTSNDIDLAYVAEPASMRRHWRHWSRRRRMMPATSSSSSSAGKGDRG